jgi:hypothetical protein
MNAIRRKILLVSIAAWLANPPFRAAAVDDFRPDLIPLVAELSDPSQIVRDAAAASIRQALKVHPDVATNDHGREFWETRIAQIKQGMAHDEVVKLLTADDRPLTFAEVSSGQTLYRVTQLDDYWIVLVYYNLTELVHEMRPVLTRRIRDEWVQPPDDFTGTWTTYFVNGQRARVVEYRGGKYHGTFTAFHDSGATSYEQHYRDGVADGADTGWYADGVQSYAGTYAQGRQHGEWTHWDVDGRMQSRNRYRNGEPHGVSETWYPDGSLQYEATYRNGKLHGRDRNWDIDGTLLWDRNYIDGKLQE